MLRLETTKNGLMCLLNRRAGQSCSPSHPAYCPSVQPHALPAFPSNWGGLPEGGRGGGFWGTQQPFLSLHRRRESRKMAFGPQSSLSQLESSASVGDTSVFPMGCFRCSQMACSPPFQGRRDPWPSNPCHLLCSLPLKAILVKKLIDFAFSRWIFGLSVLTMASHRCCCEKCLRGSPSLPLG